MHRKSLFLVFILICLATFPMLAQTGMTDQQVIEHVKSAKEAGKSQKQIMTELIAKGVTRAQAERIKKLPSPTSYGSRTQCRRKEPTKIARRLCTTNRKGNGFVTSGNERFDRTNN